MPIMDWDQVAMNGGPPCFYIEDDRYCGRAEGWQGHGPIHPFIAEWEHDCGNFDKSYVTIRTLGAKWTVCLNSNPELTIQFCPYCGARLI